jgi:TPP-dependent pyruvate/acetoin dehydrogenase alpha subunit
LPVLNVEKIKNLYELMLTIRLFEKSLFSLYDKGLLSGTIHTYLGQEAIAAGVISQTEDNDILFSSHRCHGHYLAKKDIIIFSLTDNSSSNSFLAKICMNSTRE